MSINQIWNLVIISLQLIILCIQLLLTKKINDQTISREKGYFIIEETNANVPKEDKNKFRDQFDIVNGFLIFYVVKADVILRSCTYSINGFISENRQSTDSYFTEDNRFNKLVIKLNLKEADLKKDYLDAEFIFKLRNTAGYTYKETVQIRFSKKGESSWYQISKYNMAFDK